MKRYGNLWPGLISFENLLRAATKARRGKRYRPSVAQFHFHLEPELWRLHEELAAKTYRPGPYRTFYIYEPIKRLISAAPYRDRVVHHALTGVLEAIYERSFIHDSYACRKGRGTHAAVRRCQGFLRRFPYVLKADVQKFFPSLDHEILKGLVARKVKDRDVLWLVGLLIDHGNTQEEVQEWYAGDDLFTPAERRRGLPLGNQTSQFLANVYLDPLDHFVTDRLGMAYIRYVDDFLMFGRTKAELASARAAIVERLAGLRLRLHPTKCVIQPAKAGVRFLGYRVFATHRLLAKANVWRFLRRVRRWQRAYAARQLDFNAIHPRIVSWIGHAAQANTSWLRERLFARIVFQRATAE